VRAQLDLRRQPAGEDREEGATDREAVEAEVADAGLGQQCGKGHPALPSPRRPHKSLAPRGG